MAASDSFNPAAPEVVIWADERSSALVFDVLDEMGRAVNVIGVGGERTAEVDRLAKLYDTTSADDLRKLLVDRPPAFLLVASPWRIGPRDIEMARETGATCLLLEPITEDLAVLDLALAESAAPVAFVPSLQQCPGNLAAADPAETLGTVRQIVVHSHGPADTGTAFARLFDAWCSVLAWTELPESISANITAAETTPGNVTPDAQKLADLTGWVSAHGRLAATAGPIAPVGGPGGVGVTLALSDQAATHHRRLEVRGDTGELVVTDGNYQLVTREDDGRVQTDTGGEPEAALRYPDLIARQWRRLIDRRSAARDEPSALRHREALACCLACALSARTGQGESPRRLLEIQR